MTKEPKRKQPIRPRVGRRVRFYSWVYLDSTKAPPVDDWKGTVTASMGRSYYFIRRDCDGEEVLYHSTHLAYLEAE